MLEQFYRILRSNILAFLTLAGMGLLFTPTAARGQNALGQLAASMQPGTWAQLSTNNIDAVLRQGPSTGNRLPYSMTGEWDPNRLILHFTGGDHGEGKTSHMYYDATANNWVLAGSGFATPSHGYDHNAVNPATGTLYVRQYALGGTWMFKQLPVGGSWSTVTTYNQGYQQVAIGTGWWTGALSGAGSQGAYVVYNCGEPNGQVIMWNPLTGTWFADVRNFGGSSTYHCFLEYSPKHNVAVFGGGDQNSRKVWRLNSDRTVTALPNAPVDLGIQRANVTVDPATGNFLIMGYGQFWELNPTGGGTWTQLTGSRVPPSAVGNPAVPKLDSVISASISNYGVNMYVTCTVSWCSTYLYKHGTGGGTPPPPPSFDFALSNGGSKAVTQGQATSNTVSATLVSGTTQATSFSVAGLPSGATGSFTQTSCNPTCSTTLNISTSSTTPTGNHSVNITSVAGSLTRTTAFTLTVNTSSTPPPGGTSNFQTRCSQPGVVKCVGFDSSAEITGAWGINPQGSLTGSFGGPSIDTSIKASGNGSMRFTIPAGRDGASVGSFFANFSNDLATQFGENTEFYVQWRQRFTPEFIVPGGPGAGFKQTIIGTGSRPGAPKASCTDLEVVTQNSWANGFPQMYNSCAGAPRNYDPMTESFGSYDFKLQNARPSPYCLYSQGNVNPPGYFQPTGNCFGYYANEWMTFQVHVKLGPRGQMAWPGCSTPCWFFLNSTIELWIARENQPSELVIRFTNWHLEATSNAADKYGQVWLLPYTGSDPWSATASTWYDELIISTSKIMDPTGGSGTSAVPPAAPTALIVK